ncbi:MAG: CBS domain-containing protein [Candidatus Binatia bacterium]
MTRAKNFLTVRQCMSVNPVTVEPKDALQRVVELLRRRDIRSVPVVESGKLVGMLTVTDLLRALVDQNQEVAA